MAVAVGHLDNLAFVFVPWPHKLLMTIYDNVWDSFSEIYQVFKHCVLYYFLSSKCFYVNVKTSTCVMFANISVRSITSRP